MQYWLIKFWLQLFKKQILWDGQHQARVVGNASTVTAFAITPSQGKAGRSTTCHWFQACLVAQLVPGPSAIWHPVRLALASDSLTGRKLLSFPRVRLTMEGDITEEPFVSLDTNPHWIYSVSEKKLPLCQPQTVWGYLLLKHNLAYPGSGPHY